MSEAKSSQNVRRAFRLVFALQGHSFEGLRLNQLAKALDAAPPMILRDLEVLADEGLVERIPGREELWRLTPRIVQIARAHDEEVARLQHRVGEFNQRFTRLPN